jgi:hypothetical protein
MRSTHWVLFGLVAYCLALNCGFLHDDMTTSGMAVATPSKKPIGIDTGM